MAMQICPAAVNGTVRAPASKSDAHRALLAGALSVRGTAAHCTVSGIGEWSQDLSATRGALPALGVQTVVRGDTVGLFSAACPPSPVIDCGESGTTLRLLLPVLAACGVTATLTGRGRLPQRPLQVYAACLPPHGVTWRYAGAQQLPLQIGGRLHGGSFEIPGDVSSQFVSGLLLALPLCAAGGTIRLTTPEQSAGYADMTLQTLRAAGIRAQRTPEGFEVCPGAYTLSSYTVEGDWSQAAFLLAAGALGGRVTVQGLRTDSCQRDARIVPLLRAFGADVMEGPQGISAVRAPLRAIDVDAADIPDLVPVLAVLAGAAEGTTRIMHAGRLRLKESDRLAAAAANLRRLGVPVREGDDFLEITGVDRFRPARLDGFGDHRMVMSAAVAALYAAGPVTVTDPESVNKSWPSFFETYQRIGGNCHVVDDR